MKSFRWLRLVLPVLFCVILGRADEATPPFPLLRTASPNLDRAFRIACGDITSNVMPFDVVGSFTPAKWRALTTQLVETAQTNVVFPRHPTFLAAGLDFGLFPRDTAMASWDGASFIYPETLANTFYATLLTEPGRVRIGGSYWDTVMWSVGAWEHYLTTGDRDFLKIALTATLGALDESERNEFEPALNLFRGPSVWADGISAYPDAWAAALHGEAHIVDWPRHNPKDRVHPGHGIPMEALSTNCVFYRAYGIAGAMQRELGLPEDPALATKAAALKAAINRHFWREDAGSYRYLLDIYGGSDAQEGFGQSFALLFGIASPAQAERIFANQHITPQGIACIWPTFPRYMTPGGQSFANHSGTIWPPISGVWAEASARHGKMDLFAFELRNLADHACRDNQFTEVYHPLTGEIYGGVQEGITLRSGAARDSFVSARLGDHGPTTAAALEKLYPLQPTLPGMRLWQSSPRQLWSATAYLRMVLRGLCGVEPGTDGLAFHPTLPAGSGPVTLSNLHYRQAIVTIRLSGQGQKISRLTINGQPASKLPATAQGDQLVEIALE